MDYLLSRGLTHEQATERLDSFLRGTIFDAGLFDHLRHDSAEKTEFAPPKAPVAKVEYVTVKQVVKLAR